MTVSILRTADTWWVQTPTGAARVTPPSLPPHVSCWADWAAVEAAAHKQRHRAGGRPAIVVPVTAPCRVVAQMANYASHVKDAGRDPTSDPLAFFRKASGSISGPFDDIVKPEHVRLLDYEVEIGLVIGREYAGWHRDNRSQSLGLHLRAGGGQRRFGA